MDKYEYKLKLDQIKQLVTERDYKTASQIAHTVNWRKVKSIGGLYMAGKVFEHTKHYKEAREIFLMAYDRSPLGKKILFHLTQVALKMQNLNEAEEYYQEFLQIAPRDNLKFVLQYLMAKAKGGPVEERIAILEELKEREYTEEWLYELAFLYHKANDEDKCVDTCDELILWFGEGRYVEKALELKMQHRPLNKMQQEKYEAVLRKLKEKEQEPKAVPEPEEEAAILDLNLIQAESARLAEAIARPDSKEIEEQIENEQMQEAESSASVLDAEPEKSAETVAVEGREKDSEIPEIQPDEDGVSLGVPPITFSEDRFNTSNLQVELANSMKQILGATRSETVADTMDMVKQLVKDVPYLHLQEKPIPKVVSEEDIEGQMDLSELLNPDTDKIILDLEAEKEKALEETGNLIRQLTGQMPSKEELKAAMEEPEVEPEPIVVPEPEVTEAEVEPATEVSEAIEEAKPVEEIAELAVEFESEAAATEVESEPVVTVEETKEESEPTPVEEEVQPQLERPVYVVPTIERKPVTEATPQCNTENSSFNSLTEEEKALFAYFLPVSGMEEQICQAMAGSREKRHGRTNSSVGNIIIIGGKQSGKTVLATHMTKALQRAANQGKKHLGKITAEKLNTKDLGSLIEALDGGYLLVEEAGKLSQEVATRLSLLMEQETGGLLIFLEDTKQGIRKALALDSNFASKFTEQVKIPIFTSDELVSFAKSYARERNHIIDDMGVLAVYDSISRIQKPDEAVTLTDVAKIVDQAMERIKKGGIRKVFDRGRNTKEGFILIKEKDFEN